MRFNVSKFFLLIFFCLIISVEAHAQDSNTKQKAVLVTGASSGIGLKITEVLSSKGYFVYAGARKQADLDRLNAMDNVKSVKLDVNKWDEINAAVKTIESEGRGLYGLVNNAGVAILAPLIEVEEDELDYIFNVNIYGPYRITKAFAPLIIESKGRIATISSISGILSGSFFGPYSMSKHAMEAFTDALAAEMQKFDVHVSAIEPGNYNSKISETFYNRLMSQNMNFENSRYKEEWEGLMTGFSPDRSQYKDPDEVAEAVEKALFSDNPKRRYMVVPREEEGRWTITQIMREMVQLNENQAYKYDRETLIKILDQVLEEAE
ncbi:SDR family NAD(P)-dependent oxidoreductase [Lutimonas zeaxanthinifaciens]|uniref:SDR family NAD(P)-dependent oxidoreductase n=1 Tax=Lutimonas zeaxanthinifaciens TaxID=3060215 RepID=UPI00265D395D|nr:SDR family NAD(P)-dependent oxidoreductase [Lutimonas sp. YSD2104]WKK65730.1 SDR family NAD(P)-dependent oxidoreductase [Lutimonas sp. YSD2104]